MLKDLLSENRAAIVEKWLDRIMETYPEDAQKFFRQQKDRFANPVGQTISLEINAVFDALLTDTDDSQIALLLDNIIRIRAVQDFSASEAVSFIFNLKAVARQVLAEDLKQQEIADQFLDFESHIDRLTLLAFDSYVQCKRQMFISQANQIKASSARLIEVINRKRPDLDLEAELEKGDP